MNDSGRLRGAAIGALLVLGLAQMVCDLAGWRAGKALAAASMASPAPRVFSATRGFETFSARFHLEWNGADGRPGRLAFDRAAYARLRGPYNRRNVYGAAFAYGPVLAAEPAGRRLLEQVGRHAFGGDAPLLAELGVPADAVRSGLRLRCEPRTVAPDPGLPLVFLHYPAEIAQ